MITKDMLMGDILATPEAEIIADILTESGMHCFGWPSSQMESLEEACIVHGINSDEIIKKINKAIGG